MHAAQLHALDALRALDIEDAAAGEDGDAARTGARQHVGRNIAAVVRHRHGNTRRRKVERCLVGRVVVGDDHGALVGRHRKAVGIAAECRCKHHARPVVVREHQRPLDGAGCHDDGPGAQLRQHHARLAQRRIRLQVAAVLDQHGEIAVIEALHRGARVGLDVGKAAQLIHAGNAPGLLLGIIAGKQRAAEVRVLLGQHHARPTAARRQRCRESGGAGADDQHVAEGEAHVITIRVGKVRRLAKPRRLADEGLIEHPGALGWAHEGLVVEARLEQGRQQRIHRHQVEIWRRPGILRLRHQAVGQFHHGGGDVGLSPRTFPDGEERVGLLDPGRHDAARAVILEAAAHQNLVVGEQGRSQRVTGEAKQRLAVEAGGDRLGAVNAAAAGKPAEAGHDTTPPMSLVAVLRASLNQRRQPSTCCQYSVCGPLGFSNRKT